MVDVNLSLIGKLEENSALMTFRNKASFKIGKAKRKKAYTMAIDIIVNSTDYNRYENSKANPSIQFYGYCVLVFQDMTSLEIPIHFPRQRLYYAVQHEAFRQWRQYVEFYQEYFLHRQTGITLGLILSALEIPPIEIEYQVAKTQWIELPLREVYIKCQQNTQFQVQYTAWNPIAYVDPISGEFNDGESNQEDGEKDDGLPKNGIQPAQNSPSAPFGNNPPASSAQQISDSGFEQIDDSLLNNVNPDNLPVPLVYWLEFDYYSLGNLQGDTLYQKQFMPSSLDPDGNVYPAEIIIVQTSGSFYPCGIATTFTTYQMRVNGEVTQTSNWKTNYTWNFVAKSGTAIPTPLPVQTIPQGFCN